MARILDYKVVNDVIIIKPVSLIVEVSTQDDVEIIRKPLIGKHKLYARNKKIDEYNKLHDTKKSYYKIMFTIEQDKDKKRSEYLEL